MVQLLGGHAQLLLQNASSVASFQLGRVAEEVGVADAELVAPRNFLWLEVVRKHSLFFGARHVNLIVNLVGLFAVL